MTPKWAIVLIAGIVSLLVTVWLVLGMQHSPTNAEESATPGVNLLMSGSSHDHTMSATGVGQTLYALHCSSCHGDNLEGQSGWKNAGPDGIPMAPPHDDTGHTWHHDDATLFEYTSDGGNKFMSARGIKSFDSGMPGFDGVLTDAQIDQVLRYIKSQWSEKNRDVQRERTRAATTK